MRFLSLPLILVLVGVCFAAEPKPASTPQGKEPLYNGKTLSEWVVLTKDKDEKVRARAAYALQCIGLDDRSAIPAIAELLKDKSDGVRYSAACALGLLGSRAESAVPLIIPLLKDKDEKVRRDAAYALANIARPRRPQFQRSPNC